MSLVDDSDPALLSQILAGVPHPPESCKNFDLVRKMSSLKVVFQTLHTHQAVSSMDIVSLLFIHTHALFYSVRVQDSGGCGAPSGAKESKAGSESSTRDCIFRVRKYVYLRFARFVSTLSAAAVV